MRLTKLYTRFVVLISDVTEWVYVRMTVTDSRSIFRTLSIIYRDASALEPGNQEKVKTNFLRKSQGKQLLYIKSRKIN